MIQKTFDCVDLQRKIRNKLVMEADMNIDKFFELLDKKVKSSEVNKKLIERLELEKQMTTAWFNFEKTLFCLLFFKGSI